MADLKKGGLLDTTLVVWMGEFGRTPHINPQQGRDHWPRCFSAVLAGAGIKGGQVIGATSPDGAAITERPVTVPEWLATIYAAAGVDLTRRYPAGEKGPLIPIVDGGAQPVREALAR